MLMGKTLRRKIAGDLRAHWKQFMAAWVVVVMGAAFYGAFYPAGKNLLASVYAAYDQLAYMDLQVSMDSAPLAVLNDVRAIEGVAAAEARLIVESGIQLDPDHTFLTTLRLITLPDDGQATVNANDISAGRDIQADDEILFLKRFADYHGIRPGDTVAVWLNGREYPLKVVGLVFNPEYLVAGRSREAPFPAPSAFGVAWIRYQTLAGITGAQGSVNNVAVRLTGKSDAVSPEARALARAELEKVFQAYGNVVIFEREQTASGGVIQANIHGNFQTLAMFSALFLAATVAITAVLLARQVESQRQLIGTLRALGTGRGELAIHYLTFGLLIGVTGGAVGSVAGYFLSFLTITPFVSAVAGGYLPGYANVPHVPFILLGFIIVVAATTLAGAYPAWVQSGTPPGIALRPPMPRLPNAVSRVSFHFLPLFLRQTLRNTLRTPGRSVATALGISTGAVMLFASIGLIDSMNFSFNGYFDSNQYDLRLMAGTMLPAPMLENQISKVDGVEAAQAALMGPVSVRSATGTLDTLAFVLDENDPFIVLTTLEGAPAFTSAEGVWIGHNLARTLELRVGDALSLSALGQKKEVRVLGIVSQTFGSPVFIPATLFAGWMPGGILPANTALVRVRDGQAAVARDGLAAVPGVLAVEDYAAFVGDINAYLAFWRVNAWLFAVCGALLTLAVIANTVNASLNEQKMDLAILRSLGVTRREIVTSVWAEFLLMAAIGVAVGFPIGRAVGFQMSRSVDMEFYGLVAVLHPVSIPLGVAAIVATVALATLPGLRTAFRVDLGGVSKGQSV
jgi:putative ABC transport system permease protein